MERARGTQDFSPEEMRKRQHIIRILQSVFELYGYEPLDTPVLERLETLTSKYAGGEEIVKEIFTLQDQGKRNLALRYDLTVPLCRFIAMNPTIKMPFKRYHIAPVFRDGPIKTGRYRQFTQCDVDIIGVTSINAEVEVLQLALTVFKKLKLQCSLKVNSRKILNGILESASVKKRDVETVILSIDKLAKIGKQGVLKELKQKGITASNELLELFAVTGNNSEKLKQLEKTMKSDEGKQGLAEMQALLEKVSDNTVLFEPSLARGLAYYTGIVYEAFLNNAEITSSISAGGRYDNMIGDFIGDKKQYPAVGISFGLDVLFNAMSLQETTTTRAYVIPIKTEVSEIVDALRDANIATDTDLSARGITKNLNYINTKNIPFAVIVGEKEKNAKKVTLRDMRTGKEQLVTIKEVIKILS